MFNISTQKLEGFARRAMQMYNMVEDGDRICVAVSGGKDSVALAVVLQNLSKYYEKKYTVCALTLDPCFNGCKTDYSDIENLFSDINIEYRIERTEIGYIVFDAKKEKNPCSLCAKMRRGALHRIAIEMGCNKIALGHHLDDAAETFLMNLYIHGELSCFSPVTWLSRRELTLIRPLVLAREEEVAKAAQEYPVIKSECPVDGITQRTKTKVSIAEQSKDDPAIVAKILSAMQKSGISGWAPQI